MWWSNNEVTVIMSSLLSRTVRSRVIDGLGQWLRKQPTTKRDSRRAAPTAIYYLLLMDFDITQLQHRCNSCSAPFNMEWTIKIWHSIIVKIRAVNLEPSDHRLMAEICYCDKLYEFATRANPGQLLMGWWVMTWCVITNQSFMILHVF